MKKPLLRLSHNPFFRILVFAGLLLFGLRVWQSLQDPDRSAYKAPAIALPHEMSDYLTFSPRGDAVAACSEKDQVMIAFLRKGATTSVQGTETLPLPSGVHCAPFRWSPDGRSLVMPRVHGTVDEPAPGFLLIYADASRKVESVPLPGGVDPGRMPAWSPDGRQIAYIAGQRTEKLGGLWLLDLPTRKARQLVLGVIQSPEFTPEGDRIFFAEDTALVKGAQYDAAMDDWPHIWGLGVVPAAGGKPVYMAKWRQGSLMPPNDQLVLPLKDRVRYLRYFRAPSGERFEVWDLLRSGPTERKMTLQLEPKQLNRGLRWSADGTRLVFTTYRSATLPNELSLANVETQSVVRFMEGPGAPDDRPQMGTAVGRYYFDPSISPDGSEVAVSRIWITEVENPSDHDHEDEGPELQRAEGTLTPLLLRLPSG